MADNTLQTGTDTIATDDLGAGVKVQRAKVGFGADGSLTDASEATPLPVAQTRVSTATLANVTASATNVTLLASNANRRAAYFFNDSTATLYLKFGATASTTSFTVEIGANLLYEMPTSPIYTGIIDGIWSSATGAVRVTEL